MTTVARIRTKIQELTDKEEQTKRNIQYFGDKFTVADNDLKRYIENFNILVNDGISNLTKKKKEKQFNEIIEKLTASVKIFLDRYKYENNELTRITIAKQALNNYISQETQDEGPEHVVPQDEGREGILPSTAFRTYRPYYGAKKKFKKHKKRKTKRNKRNKRKKTKRR